MSDNKAAIKEFLIYSVIRGSINSVEEFNRNGSNVDIRFRHPWYYALSVDASGCALSAMQIIETAENHEGDAVTVYGTLWVEDNILVIFCNSATEDQMEIFDRPNESMYGARIAYGEVYKGFLNIGKSLQESRSVLLNWELIPGGIRKSYGQLRDVFATHDDYPKDLVERLRVSLFSADRDHTRKILDEIMAYIRAEGRPLFLIKTFFYEASAIMYINIKRRSKADIGIDLIDILNTTDYRAIRSVFDKLAALFLEALNMAGDEDPFSAILEYIEKNHLDPQFSVQQIADHFEMSISALRLFFKKKMKRNVSDYIFELRLNKTKELLSETSEPVKSIVHSVGYYDVSSFSRKFKKAVGVSPGEYRKIPKTVP